MGDSGIWGYVMFFFHGGLEGNRYTTSARLYLAFGPGCVWKSWIQPQVLAMLMGKAWWLTNGYTDGLGSTIFRQTQHVDSAWPICCRWRVSVGQDSDIYIYMIYDSDINVEAIWEPTAIQLEGCCNPRLGLKFEDGLDLETCLSGQVRLSSFDGCKTVADLLVVYSTGQQRRFYERLFKQGLLELKASYQP